MADIKVEKLSEEELRKLNVYRWPIWKKEVSRFNWSYGSKERCYILEGRGVVETPDGEKVEFGRGDFVTFPAGLECVWDIKEDIRKHYNLGG
ncbi:MAG: cupin domain-containing protein [Elusimicrobiota bacterium]|nr:cupin domain-containing protein [Elusimicrobiota bacterium]